MPDNSTQQTRELDNSRPIDFMLECNSASFKIYLEQLYTQLAQTFAINTDGQATKNKVMLALECVVLDLHRLYKASPERFLAVSRGNDYYNSRNYYMHKGVANLFINNKVIDGLTTLGLIEFNQGFQNQLIAYSRRSRIRATANFFNQLEQAIGDSKVTRRKLPHHVRIKNTSKRLVKPTPAQVMQVQSLEDNLKTINDFNAEARIDLFITDAQQTEIEQKMWGDEAFAINQDRTHLDFTRTDSYRVFNNSSLQQGGRFYGGWWQSIPKEFRKFMVINSAPVVELDFKAMHFNMLYNKAGVDIDFGEVDPYESCLQGYDEAREGLGLTRSDIKENFFKLVNRSNTQRMGARLTRIKELIVTNHPTLEQFICSGYGVRLQYDDSVIAEKVMLRMISNGCVCLPVHDSFIVPLGKGEELKTAMKDAYKQVMNVEVAPDKDYKVSETDGVEPTITPSNQHLYTNYLQRVRVSG